METNETNGTKRTGSALQPSQSFAGYRNPDPDQDCGKRDPRGQSGKATGWDRIRIPTIPPKSALQRTERTEPGSEPGTIRNPREAGSSGFPDPSGSLRTLRTDRIPVRAIPQPSRSLRTGTRTGTRIPADSGSDRPISDPEKCSNVLTRRTEHLFDHRPSTNDDGGQGSGPAGLMQPPFSGANATPIFRGVFAPAAADRKKTKSHLTNQDRKNTVRLMGNEREATTTEDGMTGTDVIDYLGLQEDCRIAVDRDRHLAIIEFAEDRGHYVGVWNGIAVEYATALANGLDGYDDYDGNLDDDLAIAAGDAIEYLTEAGLLPNGYGTRRPGHREGFGLLLDFGEGS